jgi:tellurite methyltransferase
MITPMLIVSGPDRQLMKTMPVATRFSFEAIYQKHAHYYGTIPAEHLRRLLRMVHVAGMPIHRALDVGSGQGRDAIYLASQDIAVTALDFSQAGMAFLTQYARAHSLHIQTSVADAATYAYPAEEYDLVTATTLFDHLSADEQSAVAEGMMHALRPGGVGHVMVFTRDDPGYHVRIEHEETFRSRMSETAEAVEHYFTNAQELEALFHGMDVLECQSYTYMDDTHGPIHDHCVAYILFRKP